MRGLGREPGSGRLSRFFARVLENPENPLGWSVRLFTLDGITVGLHVFTIVFFGVMLLSSIALSNVGLPYMAVALASLFVIVLLHEFGHCYACRWVGGSADRIVMLPFGGLALIRPPRDWRSDFISTAGGPLVNVLIAPVTALALLAGGEPGSILFNPLDPSSAMPLSAAGAAGFALRALWWFHYVNIVILLFNLLLPMYPFDGGRLIHALAWRSAGYARATRIAVNVGMVGAMVLGVVSLVMQETILLAIAIFGGWACWAERRRLMSDEVLAEAGYGIGDFRPEAEPEDPGPSRRDLKRIEAEQREQQELDRILAKISSRGMESLSGRERKLLDRASKKKRTG